jgi:hypothetical protein
MSPHSDDGLCGTVKPNPQRITWGVSSAIKKVPDLTHFVDQEPIVLCRPYNNRRRHSFILPNLTEIHHIRIGLNGAASRYRTAKQEYREFAAFEQ